MLYVACIVLAGRQDLVSTDKVVRTEGMFGDWGLGIGTAVHPTEEAKKSQIICSQSLIL